MGMLFLEGRPSRRNRPKNSPVIRVPGGIIVGDAEHLYASDGGEKVLSGERESGSAYDVSRTLGFRR